MIKQLTTLMALYLLSSPAYSQPYQSVRIQILDRGQADGIVIRTPNEQWIVIDAGTNAGQADYMEEIGLDSVALFSALSGARKETLLCDFDTSLLKSEKVISISQGDYAFKEEHEISGSGSVVESLEAALWSFSTTESFSAAILTAANLGD